MSLPSRGLAEVVFNHYIEKIHWVYRIIHVPTTRGFLNALYEDLDKSKAPEIHQLALIATLLAIGAHFWKEQQGISFTLRDAEQASKKWCNLGRRCITESNYEEHPTIETLQATILSEQYLPLSKSSTSYRGSIGAIVRSAQILGLHQIDSKRNIALRNATGGFSHVDLEIKRRLWWHIVTCDW
jgi:hypothetical protein